MVVTGLGWAVVVSVVALAAFVGSRRLAAPDAQQFARGQGLTLTEGNRPVVDGYLARARSWRLAGTLVGLLFGITWVESRRPVNTLVVFSSTWLFAGVAGYFAGALAAEVRGGAGHVGPRREASLTPRSRADYVPPGFVSAGYVLAAVAAAVFVVGSLATDPAPPGAPAWELRLAASIAVLAVGALVDTASRYIARRGRRSADPDAAAAYEAVGRTAARLLNGYGLALAAWLLSGEALATYPLGHPLVRTACVAIGAGAGVAAAGCWLLTIWFTGGRGTRRRR